MSKKINLSNLSAEGDRKKRALSSLKKGIRKAKYKKGDYPSSNAYKKNKEFRDGWFK